MDVTYNRASISATAAQVIMTACIRKTAELDEAVAVVVVDEEGAPKAVVRMDDVPAFRATAAHDRARAVLAGEAGEVRTRPATHGHRLVVDGRVIGAVAVSGAGPAKDATIAAAGLAAVGHLARDLEMLAGGALEA